MNTSRILELSKIIRTNTENIHNDFASNGVPFPTFNPDGSTGVPEHLSTARDAVADATSELHDLLLDPMDLLSDQRNVSVLQLANLSPNKAMLTQHDKYNMIVMHVILRFSIAKNIPLDGTISFAALSKATGLAEPILKRFVRYAITMRIFQEPEQGILSHTNLSKALADPTLHEMMGSVSEGMWPAAVKVFSLPSIF